MYVWYYLQYTDTDNDDDDNNFLIFLTPEPFLILHKLVVAARV